MSIVAFFDGLCEPYNPGGLCCYGYVIYREDELIRGHGFIGKGTNNLAEYTAVIKVLEKAKELNIDSLTVKGNSRLVVNQLRGLWAVRSPKIIPLHRKASKLIKKFKSVHIEWVPREKNQEADRLSRIAYQEAYQASPTIKEPIIAAEIFEKERGGFDEQGIISRSSFTG